MKRSPITSIEKIDGWWVVKGLAGTRRYLWYTKVAAMRRYRQYYREHCLKSAGYGR